MPFLVVSVQISSTKTNGSQENAITASQLTWDDECEQYTKTINKTTNYKLSQLLDRVTKFQFVKRGHFCGVYHMCNHEHLNAYKCVHRHGDYV